MSLVRTIRLFVFGLVCCLFLSLVTTQFLSSRQSFIHQIEANIETTMTSLMLTLPPLVLAYDDTGSETYINAMFDGGFVKSIQLKDPEGNVRFERNVPSGKELSRTGLSRDLELPKTKELIPLALTVREIVQNRQDLYRAKKGMLQASSKRPSLLTLPKRNQGFVRYVALTTGKDLYSRILIEKKAFDQEFVLGKMEGSQLQALVVNAEWLEDPDFVLQLVCLAKKLDKSNQSLCIELSELALACGLNLDKAFYRLRCWDVHFSLSGALVTDTFFHWYEELKPGYVIFPETLLDHSDQGYVNALLELMRTAGTLSLINTSEQESPGLEQLAIDGMAKS